MSHNHIEFNQFEDGIWFWADFCGFRAAQPEDQPPIRYPVGSLVCVPLHLSLMLRRPWHFEMPTDKDGWLITITPPAADDTLAAYPFVPFYQRSLEQSCSKKTFLSFLKAVQERRDDPAQSGKLVTSGIQTDFGGLRKYSGTLLRPERKEIDLHYVQYSGADKRCAEIWLVTKEIRFLRAAGMLLAHAMYGAGAIDQDFQTGLIGQFNQLADPRRPHVKGQQTQRHQQPGRR